MADHAASGAAAAAAAEEAPPVVLEVAEIATVDGALPRGTLLLQPCDTPGHAFPVPAIAVAALSAQLRGIALAVCDEDVALGGGHEEVDSLAGVGCLPADVVAGRVLPLSAECADVGTVQRLATWLCHHRDGRAAFEPPMPLPSVYDAPTAASLFAGDAWTSAYFGAHVCPRWDYAGNAIHVTRLHKAATYLGLTALSRACAVLTAFHLREAAASASNPMRVVAAWRPPPRAGEWSPPPLTTDADLEGALAWARDTVDGLEPLRPLRVHRPFPSSVVAAARAASGVGAAADTPAPLA